MTPFMFQKFNDFKLNIFFQLYKTSNYICIKEKVFINEILQFELCYDMYLFTKK